MAKMLSKSNFMNFLQCRKRLWLHKFRPELEAETSEATQRIFDQGFEVEKYAYDLFPGGVDVGTRDVFEGEKKTRALIEQGSKVIFQASVIAASTSGTGRAGTGARGAFGKARGASGKARADLLARSDIIKYNAKAKAWDLYEVKSTTEVKEDHIRDLAFQKIVFELAGYKVNKTYVVHVNNEYVRKGAIEAKKFIKIEEVTTQVKEATSEVQANIPLALKVLNEKVEPRVRIIKQCYKPYQCPFIDYCWPQAKIPEYSVYDLTGVSEKKLTQLLDMGIMEIKNIPDDFDLSSRQEMQVLAEKSGEPIIDEEEVKEALKGLKYPLYFLDYETLNPGVPLWDGFHPYQQACFQYSVHVVRTPADLSLDEDALEHHEFLARGNENPIPALLEQLQKDIPDDGGTVLVWNAGFEKSRNNEMAEICPEYAGFLKSVNERVVDLMKPFEARYYVDPGFKGSHSIKYVLPVLGGGVSYEDIEIGEGSDVGRQWLQSVSGEMPAEEVKATRKRLLDYCGRDTYGIVRVLKTVMGVGG